MHIDGWTLALQAINFLILAWLLRHFLYRPVLAVIAERQAATQRVRDEADAVRRDADALKSGLAAERAGLAAERDRMLADARAQATADHDALLAKARGEADRLLADARATLAEERRQALADLRARAARLGTDVAGTLLHAAGVGSVTDGFLDAACRGVEELAEARRHALAGPDTPVPVRLVAAVPLADAAPWCHRLAAALGRPVAVETAVDPDLIAGVELHFPHTVLRHSWKQALAEATEELIRDDHAERRA